MKVKMFYDWNNMSVKKQIRLAKKLFKLAAKGNENARVAHRLYLQHITKV